jgi:iron complex outermembrane receptor protein
MTGMIPAAAAWLGLLACQQPEGERTLPDDLATREIRTGSPRPMSLDTMPSTVTVITKDRLWKSGVRFLADAFRMAPGFEVMRHSATEVNIAVRGFNDESSASMGIIGLVDGRPVYNEFYGNVLWDTLPVSVDEIRQVELLRGPGSFVHGPNAMHGLVNIVTRSPLEYGENELRMSGMAGSYRSFVQTLTHVRHDGDTGLKTTVGWDDIASFEDRDHGVKRKLFGTVRLESRLDADRRVGFAFGATRQRTTTLLASFLGVPRAVFTSEIEDLFFEADYEAGPVRAQLSGYRMRALSVPDQAFTGFELRLDTADLDVQAALVDGDAFHLNAGAGYRFSTFETRDSDVSEGSHAVRLGWFFLHADALLAEGLVLTAGARGDQHSTTGASVSPRVALVWEFTEKQHVRVSFATGLRNPSLREIWFEMPVNIPGLPGPMTIRGNKELDPERMKSYELAYFGRPFEWIRIEVAAFYNLVDDIIEFSSTAFFPSPPAPPGTPSEITPTNVRDDRVYGAEVEGEILLSHRFLVFGNFSYTIRQNRGTGDREPIAPRVKTALGFRTLLGESVSAMLWGSYFDETEMFGRRVPAYTLINGRIGLHVASGEFDARLFVQAFNLLNDRHRENSDGEEYGLILMGGAELEW